MIISAFPSLISFPFILRQLKSLCFNFFFFFFFQSLVFERSAHPRAKSHITMLVEFEVWLTQHYKTAWSFHSLAKPSILAQMDIEMKHPDKRGKWHLVPVIDVVLASAERDRRHWLFLWVLELCIRTDHATVAFRIRKIAQFPWHSALIPEAVICHCDECSHLRKNSFKP